MNRNTALSLGAAVLLLAGAPEALAQTTAGTQIGNQATVTYTVDSVEQTIHPEGDVTFFVDRRVDLVVNEVAGGFTTVAPGVTPDTTNGKYLTFTVTNNTNDTIDVKLTADQLSGETVHGGADNADTAALTLYGDDGGTANAWDGTDTALPTTTGGWYLDQVAAGATVTVYVVSAQFADAGTAPGELENGDIMGVVLTGIAHSAWDDDGLPILQYILDPLGTPTTYLAHASGAGSLGDKLDADTDGDDQYKVENVYADAVDTDGSGDAANNGQDDAYDAYKVASAAIEVIKRSAVYYDPINGEDPSAVAIPGSLILYCITVKNTGTENAVDVTVVDDLTTETVTNSTIAFADSTTVLTNDITSADSIRFSTTDDCTAALWDSGTDESSDGTDGSSDGLEGDYNVTSPNKVTTKVPTLAGTTGVTTTMFMVEVQ